MEKEHMPRIIVTGAAGRLGSAVIGQLLRIAPQSLVAVTTRDPQAARSWSDERVEVRRGDFDHPSTLPDAFRGAERLLIISTSADNATRIRQHRNAFEAAREAGVGHVYYTSVMQREGSPFLAAKGHLQSEVDLGQAAARSTVFRNGQYMENFPLFLRVGLEGDTINLPADGPTSWVALHDLAEGIAHVLAGEEAAQDSQILTLTGPEAVDFTDIARIAGKALGRHIERKVISPEAFVERVTRQGLSHGFAQLLESGFRSRASGELSTVDPALQQIVGRRLRRVEDELPLLLEKMTEGNDRWATRFREAERVTS
jgi:NAD(P)H dehydrogenase (quinone)